MQKNKNYGFGQKSAGNLTFDVIMSADWEGEGPIYKILHCHAEWKIL